MIEIPYLKINQNDEFFFISKLRVKDLKKLVSFHYRHDTGLFKNEDDFEKYIDDLSKKGINVSSDKVGIQRRLELKRINDIKNYYENSGDKVFPTTIILSADAKDETFFDKYLSAGSPDFGKFSSNELKSAFRIIDGQHRLAGIFSSKKPQIDDLEISVTIIFGISIPEEAKLFSIINGKQKAVSQSLIYDLQDEIGKHEIKKIFMYHNICKTFNETENSPLYRQIKMLGMGQGSISQSFFIDYLNLYIKEKTDLFNLDTQELYTELFLYFKAFQKVFPLDWPIPFDIKDKDYLKRYSDIVKRRKSQLLKTNGFGAILQIFPIIYEKHNGSFSEYYKIISKLKCQINWRKVSGTGKKAQNNFRDQILTILK